MIEIRSFGSSSAGNCYHISDGRTELLLEAGLRFTDIRKALEFRVSRLAGCLISHNHGDHSRAAIDLMKAGVTVYASQGTFDAMKIGGHRARVIRSKETFEVGTWTVMPFDVEHDVDEPLGFLLANQDSDKLAFLTDTYYCRYTFSGLTHLMVECNYSLRILDENIAAGRVYPAMRSRLLRSHFSLENVKDFLRANDITRLQEIHLLHLSDSNSDEALFKREIQSITGKPVYVAGR
ncbi:MBL fold metallo-hydrolase [Cohnella xylanilytica]|uniref:MBL fold metallo-hydrolase n=1 Tax=Cohnella xylanilytica TaxID=557555 RepID=A0A841TVC3_9BACL|nr:MBL fold metallo-hydrolase [Cohnella xylanilytica]MBB6689941.1 MBL fold metallo-hydrolase [Cohnella xylanilytica]